MEGEVKSDIATWKNNQVKQKKKWKQSTFIGMHMYRCMNI